MITTALLRRQAWMANNEFDYIVKNSQKVLKLNDQYKNHPYLKNLQNSVVSCLYKEHTRQM